MSELLKVRLIVTMLAAGGSLLLQRWFLGSWADRGVMMMLLLFCFVVSCWIIRPADDYYEDDQ